MVGDKDFGGPAGNIGAGLFLAAGDRGCFARFAVVLIVPGAPAQKLAAQAARAVPQEICTLCLKSVSLTPYLVEKGNPFLISDVEVAVELLLSAFNSARVMVRINS